MNKHQRILIKDPYLNTSSKEDHHYGSYIPMVKPVDRQPNIDNFKWKMEHDMRRQLQQTHNDYKRMAMAFNEQNMLNQKILDYQAANNQYHEGLKLRNLDLNNRLSDVQTQNYLMAHRFEEDVMKNYHEKDLLVRKFQDQAEQLLQARRTINNLIELKTKMEGEMQYLTFELEKQTDKFNLLMKEQMLKTEGLERSMKILTDTKDQEIAQLRHRIRVYEDENKRLNDENRTLQIVNASQKSREQQLRGGLQNLSQIPHIDSQTKQFKDQQGKKLSNQLNQQKNINEQLQKQINELKKKLFQKDENIEYGIENDVEKYFRISPRNTNENGKINEVTGNQVQNFNPESLINSINTLRNGISKQIFQLFYKSVKDGEKNRSNSLVIFIQNWKQLDLQRIYPYILSYFQARDTLKEICLSDKYAGKPINDKIQQCIPLRVSLKKGRSQINIWILSTIQFTKNQRQTSKKSMNNLLLFLFRLLTIHYRINYPMQGKSYVIDADVRNELQHQLVKAVNYIIQFQ